MGSKATEVQIEIDHRYFKIHYLINAKATELLRGQFTSLWAEVTGKEWVNEEWSGRMFAEGIGRDFVAACPKLQKKSVDSGNVATWDLTLLTGAIRTIYQNLNNRPPQGKFITIKEMDDLKHIRNKLAHLGSTTIEASDFETFWTTAVGIMERLGLGQEDIEVLNKLEYLSLNQVEEGKNEVPTSEEEKASKFKEMGNSSFKGKDYRKAIDFYTSAIHCEGIPSSTLGILYSNRSASFLSLDKLEEAKEDAKRAVTLKPYWVKAYSRLAAVYEMEGKFWKALTQYEISLSIEPKYKDALNGVEHCKKKIATLHFEPVQDPSPYIKRHVEMLATSIEIRSTAVYLTNLTIAAKFEENPPDILGLKPITFREFENGASDKVYKGFAIQLKAVTDVVQMTGVSVVAMDTNGHFGAVVIYDYPSIATMQDEIGFGCSFTVINPYYKLCFDGQMVIRVEDPGCVLKLAHLKDPSICRYCFKPGADFKCRRCFRAKYCCNKCCKEDLQKRSHQLACRKKI